MINKFGAHWVCTDSRFVPHLYSMPITLQIVLKVFHSYVRNEFSVGMSSIPPTLNLMARTIPSNFQIRVKWSTLLRASTCHGRPMRSKKQQLIFSYLFTRLAALKTHEKSMPNECHNDTLNLRGRSTQFHPAQLIKYNPSIFHRLFATFVSFWNMAPDTKGPLKQTRNKGTPMTRPCLRRIWGTLPHQMAGVVASPWAGLLTLKEHWLEITVISHRFKCFLMISMDFLDAGDHCYFQANLGGLWATMNLVHLYAHIFIITFLLQIKLQNWSLTSPVRVISWSHLLPPKMKVIYNSMIFTDLPDLVTLGQTISRNVNHVEH